MRVGAGEWQGHKAYSQKTTGTVNCLTLRLCLGLFIDLWTLKTNKLIFFGQKIISSVPANAELIFRFLGDAMRRDLFC